MNKYLFAKWLLVFLLIAEVVFSQGTGRSGPPLPDAHFYAGRREALRQLLPKHAVAVFFTSPERIRTGDFPFPYAPDPHFFYLTGSREAHGILFVFTDSVEWGGYKSNEFLVVQDKVLKEELWTGKRMGAKGAAAELGFGVVFGAHVFDSLVIDFKQCAHLFVSYPRDFDAMHPCEDNRLLGKLVNHFNAFVEGLPVESPDALLARLRVIKLPEEIALEKYAISISVQGHRALMQKLRPGMFEYQAQAIMEYEFKSGGAEFVAYSSICGSGENSCTLHYDKNDRLMQQGDLLLADCGAEYHGYCADVTRTLPVSGHFTEAQRQIYELVLKAQEAGIAACLPGNTFDAQRKVAQETIAEGLVALGIIKEASAYRTYFMHGTSHFVGLEVHDVGKEKYLQPGELLTVEPGIYIPAGSDCDPKFWNIGVRIEDDILITDTGYVNLSGDAPRAVAAVEALMNGSAVK